jgi:hypothetical protein
MILPLFINYTTKGHSNVMMLSSLLIMHFDFISKRNPANKNIFMKLCVLVYLLEEIQDNGQLERRICFPIGLVKFR